MAIFTELDPTYTIADLGFDKSLVKVDKTREALDGVIPELRNIFLEGIAPKNIIAGELISSLEQQVGALFSGKTDFDNSQIGYRIGIDSDSLPKLYVGTTSDYFNFDGINITISGTISAGAIDIGGSDATSFHVDADGNMWLGTATFAAAPFSITNSGDLFSASATIIGSITSTSGTIGGWIISATTLSSASSGERIIFNKGNSQIELLNSTGNVVFRLKYGSATTAAYELIHIQNDARRGIEFIVDSALGDDAKCITIDNPSTSICIDMTDAGSIGINIAGASTSGITITHNGTGAGIDVSASGSAAGAITVGGGDYPSIDITQNGTATNSFGIRITQSTAALNDSIFIDCNADAHTVPAITIDRDGYADNQIVEALVIECANSGIGGKAVGIDFRSTIIQAIMNVATDTTDPTGGGGAATGRIPIYVDGNLKYLAYY